MSVFERAGMLLHIVEKCAGHSGKLGHLSNAAMKELLEINDGIRDDAIKSKEAEAAEAARQQEEADARAEEEEAARLAEAQRLRDDSAQQLAREQEQHPDKTPPTLADRRI